MRVLVIAPHPDDEVLGVGGTIAKHVQNGDEVRVCIVTKGVEPLYSEEGTRRTRQCTLEAHSILGVARTIFLDFPAVLLNDTPKYQLNMSILNVVNEFLPDVCYIPHKGDMHHDHAIVNEASMVALRPIYEHQVKEIYMYETLSETEWNLPDVSHVFIPNTWIDISQTIDIKIEALKKYNELLKPYPHPRSIESVITLAKLRGSTVCKNYVESFNMVRKIK